MTFVFRLWVLIESSKEMLHPIKMGKWLTQKLSKGVSFRVFVIFFQVIRFDGGEEVFISGEFNSLRKVMPFCEYNILAAKIPSFKNMQEPHKIAFFCLC